MKNFINNKYAVADSVEVEDGYKIIECGVCHGKFMVPDDVLEYLFVNGDGEYLCDQCVIPYTDNYVLAHKSPIDYFSDYLNKIEKDVKNIKNYTSKKLALDSLGEFKIDLITELHKHYDFMNVSDKVSDNKDVDMCGCEVVTCDKCKNKYLVSDLEKNDLMNIAFSGDPKHLCHDCGDLMVKDISMDLIKGKLN